jgi:hypothetical protein
LFTGLLALLHTGPRKTAFCDDDDDLVVVVVVVTVLL